MDGQYRSLQSELAELYASYVEDRAVNLPPLLVQYADYALWQRTYLSGEVLEGETGILEGESCGI